MSTESNNNTKSNKVAWSSNEDSVLLKLVGELGTNGSWTIISSKMGSRTGKQCRERYHNHLKPDVNKALFSKEEDELVNELQKKMGNQWAKMAKFFKGRTDNAVKNRWHIINRCKPSRANAETVIVRKQPFIPMLNLNAVAQSVIKFNDGSDLQSLYHSHECHGHEITDSSRSRPPTGRRSARADNNCVAERHSMSMEQVIFAQSQQLTCSSLSSTMTSSSSGNSYSDNSCSDEDSWLDDLLSGDDPFSSDYSSSSDDDWSQHDQDGDEGDALCYSRDGLKTLLNRDVFADEDDVQFRTQSASRAYDTFSEAALTAREDPDCLSESEGNDCERRLLADESDDLFLLFDDNMSLCGGGGSSSSAKPSPQLRCFLSRLSELTPRTTPRSPACPNVKRHRGAPPGGSPFRLTA